MTGECGNILRHFGLEPVMQERGYPVKHGVKVFSPSGKYAFWVPVMARDEETGLREATTWQVPRDEFDDLMLKTARERGAEFIQGEAIEVHREDGEVTGVRVKRDDGELVDIAAKVIVDASGPASFLSKAGVIGRKERGNYDNQVAIFSQVKGAVRDPDDGSGNTLIFYQKQHHWAWFIPIDDERTSIGVVVPVEHFKAAKQSKMEFLQSEMKAVNPNLAERIEDITFVEEARAVSNYSYEIPEYTGRGYLCVGDSHRFIDPVFSFGLHFAVKEGRTGADAIADFLSGKTADESNPFAQYQHDSTLGMDAIQDLLDAFWEKPTQFALIVHQKYREEMIDLFAGRITEEPSKGLLAIRKVLEVAGLRPKAA
jgi:flavin-dependent dehydrogenase